MKKANLVQNGIFPIIFDENKKRINQQLDTGLKFPGTIQGEGLKIGVPSLFVRFSGCPLRCAWVGSNGMGSPCDTPYSSHSPEKNHVDVDTIVKIVENNSYGLHPEHATQFDAIRIINDVVITGGEPTAQPEVLVELCRQLNELGYAITIETNGMHYVPDLSKYVELMSISPKLSSSTPWEANLKGTPYEYNIVTATRHESRRYVPDVLRKYYEEIPCQFKFVVSQQSDIDEIIRDFIIGGPEISPCDVMLMPEGVTPEELTVTSRWVAGEAIRHGFSFTPRLHALVFGIARGV